MNCMIKYFLFLFILVSCSEKVVTNEFSDFSFNKTEKLMIHAIIIRNYNKKNEKNPFLFKKDKIELVDLQIMRLFLKCEVEVVLDVLFLNNSLKKWAIIKETMGFKGLKIKALKRLRKEYLKKNEDVKNMNKKYFRKKFCYNKYKWVDNMISKFGKEHIKKNIVQIGAILNNQKYRIVTVFEKLSDDFFIAQMKYLEAYLYYFMYFKSNLKLLRGGAKIETRVKVFMKIIKKIRHNLYEEIIEGYLSREKAKTYYNQLKLPKLKKFIGDITNNYHPFSVFEYMRKKVE